jgi:predicted amidohydrolase
MESEFSRAGDRLIPPVQTPIGKLGLSICYDMRFAELALWNRYQGAEILSFPSAFTLNTGLAHWEARFNLNLSHFLYRVYFDAEQLKLSAM